MVARAGMHLFPLVTVGVALSLIHLPSSETALSGIGWGGSQICWYLHLLCCPLQLSPGPYVLASRHPLSNQGELSHNSQHSTLFSFKLNGFPGDTIMSELRYGEKNLCKKRKRKRERQKQTESFPVNNNIIKGDLGLVQGHMRPQCWNCACKWPWGRGGEE